MRLRDFKEYTASEVGEGIKQPGTRKSLPDKNEPVQNKDYYLIESKLLDGEIIILCKIKSALPYLRKEFPGTVIYFPPEIEELYKIKDDQDAVKKVHLVKKRFGGWIVPGSNTINASRKV